MENKAQAAYDLLLMLSVIDGEIDEVETSVIQDFIKRKYPENTIDFEAENSTLVQLSPQALLARFQDAALLLLEQCDIRERTEIVGKALDVVMSDGAISKKESTVFKGLSEVWEIPLAPLLASRAHS
jgi:uncharacterized tellurite resistance protein B-like protein